MLNKLKQYLLENGYEKVKYKTVKGDCYIKIISDSKDVSVAIKEDEWVVHDSETTVKDWYSTARIHTQKDLDNFIQIINMFEGWVSE